MNAVSVPYYGAFYRETTCPLLSERATAAEAKVLASLLEECTVSGPVLDLGCGHGRHLLALAASTPRRLYGMDADVQAIPPTIGSATVVYADFTKAWPSVLPQMAIIYCWYNSLAHLREMDLHEVLGFIRKQLLASGWFLLQVTLATDDMAQGTVHQKILTTQGAVIEEWATYNSQLQEDTIVRRLSAPEQTPREACVVLHYFSERQWRALAEQHGFRCFRVVAGDELFPSQSLGRDALFLFVGG